MIRGNDDDATDIMKKKFTLAEEVKTRRIANMHLIVIGARAIMRRKIGNTMLTVTTSNTPATMQATTIARIISSSNISKRCVEPIRRHITITIRSTTG